MDSGCGKSVLKRSKDFRIPQHGEGKETRHVKPASPGLANPPAAGKHDTDSEKQAWLSVWTTSEQAARSLYGPIHCSTDNTAVGDHLMKAYLKCTVRCNCRSDC